MCCTYSLGSVSICCREMGADTEGGMLWLVRGRVCLSGRGRSSRGFLVFIPEERLKADSKLHGLDAYQTMSNTGCTKQELGEYTSLHI